MIHSRKAQHNTDIQRTRRPGLPMAVVLVLVAIAPGYAASGDHRSGTLVEQGGRLAIELRQAEEAQRQLWNREWRDFKVTTTRVTTRQARVSKRKAAVVGALVGAGGGALLGAVYCQADCGGGPARGALVFASIGAGLGAGAGVLIGWLADRAP